MLTFLAALVVQSTTAPPADAPPAPGVSGRARLDCVVTEAGRLTGCVVLSETPADQGIGRTALDYAATMTVKLGDGPNTFRPGAHFVRDLKVDMPLAQKQEGYADIRCRVTEGKLEACVVLKEFPTGMGYGDSALKMAKLFQMKASSDAAGATYQTRIRFKLED